MHEGGAGNQAPLADRPKHLPGHDAAGVKPGAQRRGRATRAVAVRDRLDDPFALLAGIRAGQHDLDTLRRPGNVLDLDRNQLGSAHAPNKSDLQQRVVAPGLERAGASHLRDDGSRRRPPHLFALEIVDSSVSVTSVMRTSVKTQGMTALGRQRKFVAIREIFLYGNMVC
jgi:hypothetical protein